MAQVNLGHVKGDKGDTGSQGPQGIQGIQGVQGPAGPGCPTGGTAGQVLMKDSGTDYDYLWSNINKSTHRTVPFAVGTNEWTLSSGVYTAEFTTAYITTTSFEELFMDNSFYTYGKAQIKATKKSGGGGLILTTATIPTGTITGTLKIIDTDDGKVPVIIEDTTVAIANGGTGQSTVAGVRSAFSIPDVVDNLTTNDGTKALSAKQGYTLNSKIATYNFSDTFANQSELESALLNFGDTIGYLDVRNIRFSFSPTPSSGVFNGRAGFWFGTIKRSSSGRYCVEVQDNSNSTRTSAIVTGSYSTANGWVWDTPSDNIDTLSNKLGGFKIEKYEGTLDSSSATNVYSTGITYSKYANVGIVVNNLTRTSSSTGLTAFELKTDGTLTLYKSSSSWGSTNKFYLTVIHD